MNKITKKRILYDKTDIMSSFNISQDSSSTSFSSQQLLEDRGGSSTATTPDLECGVDAAALMPAPEEPPYFPERYPGKLCVLCNLGERSQLGQGEILKLEVSTDNESKSNFPSPTASEDRNSSFDDDKSPRGLTSQQAINRRQKGLNKCK
jgi:hypothetical protein